MAASIPLGEISPAQISSACLKTYSLHHVATFLLRRELGGCGERSSARPSRQAARSAGERSVSGEMPWGAT